MKVQFFKKDQNATIPVKGTKKSVGYDLCVLEDTIINPFSIVLVKTGIVAIPPEGYYFDLVIRSSFPIKNKGIILANSIGIIDPDYSGIDDEIKIALFNTSSNSQIIPEKTRIAQLILRKYYEADIEEVLDFSVLKNTRGGFGSTGEK